MSNFASLSEAWGCETFVNKKKKKKRRKKKDHNQNYKRSSPSMDTRRMVNSNRAEPIRIQIEEENDYEGYNSSDYDQYEIDTSRDVRSTMITEEPPKEREPVYRQEVPAYSYDARVLYSNGQRVEQDDRSVFQEEEEGCDIPAEAQYIADQTTPYLNTTTNSVVPNHQLNDEIIQRLYEALDRIENKQEGENMYDVLLFVFFGVFILFIIDYMYKIGVKTSSRL